MNLMISCKYKNYRNALVNIAFIHLLEFSDITYHNLVRIFYANATYKEVDEEDVDEVPRRELTREIAYVTTYIFGQVIRVTPEVINNILGTKGGNIFFFFNEITIDLGKFFISTPLN